MTGGSVVGIACKPVVSAYRVAHPPQGLTNTNNKKAVMFAISPVFMAFRKYCCRCLHTLKAWCLHAVYYILFHKVKQIAGGALYIALPEHGRDLVIMRCTMGMCTEYLVYNIIGSLPVLYQALLAPVRRQQFYNINDGTAQHIFYPILIASITGTGLPLAFTVPLNIISWPIHLPVITCAR